MPAVIVSFSQPLREAESRLIVKIGVAFPVPFVGQADKQPATLQIDVF